MHFTARTLYLNFYSADLTKTTKIKFILESETKHSEIPLANV